MAIKKIMSVKHSSSKQGKSVNTHQKSQISFYIIMKGNLIPTGHTRLKRISITSKYFNIFMKFHLWFLL